MGDPELPPSSISDPHHHDDRTRSFQLAHNIHILPHLPKYSIIIQKKSNELLGKLLQGKSYKGKGRGEGRETFQGREAVCVVSSEPNPNGSKVGLASSPLGSPLHTVVLLLRELGCVDCDFVCTTTLPGQMVASVPAHKPGEPLKIQSTQPI